MESSQAIVMSKVGENPIRLTQFLRPNGRPVYRYWYSNSDRLEKKAEDIIKRGFVFQMEVLRTGQVSITVTDPAPGGSDIDIEICANTDTKVDASIVRLIERAHAGLGRVAS